MPDAPKKKLDLNRREMPKQPPQVRRHNFSEVALGYPAELAVEEAERCLQCKKSQCVGKCPVEIDIPGFIRCIAERDFAGGVRILKQKNCLPAICGRVCPQEEQCEEACVLRNKGGQIAIGRLERFLADWEAAQGPPAVGTSPRPTEGRRRGRCRSAGLTVAAILISQQIAVSALRGAAPGRRRVPYGIRSSGCRRPS
jgi:glutamate synthase (NADPH/NADH) small chain